MYEAQRPTRSGRLFTLTLLVVGAAAVAAHFDLLGHIAYALEKGRLRATAEELAQVEQHDRVIGMVAEMVRPAVVNIRTQSGIREEAEAEEGLDPAVEREWQNLPEELRKLFEGPEQFRRHFRNPEREQRNGVGSGVIIDADKGFILTNNHVIEGADRIDVYLKDRRHFIGKLVGADPKTELAVIQIEPDRLHALKLGDSDDMFVGSTVLAVGAPFNLEQTVTKGIVSARGRSTVEIADYEDFIQTDAAINPGNSGGPLVNLRGEVIGINTAIATSGMVAGYMGIGFAIPSNMIKEYLPYLMEGKPIVRGYLGVQISNLSDRPGKASHFGYHSDKGVLIEDVLDDGPAARSGLKYGDIVIEFDGNPVSTTTQLSGRVARTKPNSTVPIKVWRKDKEETIQVTIEPQPDGFSTRPWRFRPSEPKPKQKAEDPELGVTVEELTPELAKDYGWNAEEETGVVVTEVKPGSEAANEGFRPGDLIQEVNREKVADVADFKRLMEGQSIKEGIFLYVRSKQGGQSVGRFVYLRVQ